MSFTQKIKDLLNKDEYEDDDYDYEYEDDDDNEEEVKPKYSNHNNSQNTTKFRSVKGGLSEMEIINFALANYEMTAEVFEYIKSKQPAIVNMEKLEAPDAQRALDYLSGATKALSGSVEKVAESIFLFAPEHVKIYPTKNNNAYGATYTNMPTQMVSSN